MHWAGPLGLALGLGQADPAQAQQADQPPAPPALAPGGYAPPTAPVPEGVGVADRPRLDYLPVGGRLGSFFLYPTFGITSGATDNLRANDTQKMADSYVKLDAGAQLVSGFSRHALKLGGYFNRPFYMEHPREDTAQYGGSLQGTLNFAGPAEVDLGATVERRIVPREDYTSPYGAIAPIREDRKAVRLGYGRSFNRLSLYASGSLVGETYHNGETDAGTLLDQRYRNDTDYAATLSLEYHLRPGLGLVVRGAYDRRVYSLPASDPAQPGGYARDSQGWRVEGGTRLSFTGTLYGEVRVGYMARLYVDPRLRDTRGPSFLADLSWNPTGLTTLRLTADRRVDEAASATAAGNQVTLLGLGVDHELRHNLITSLGGQYEWLVPLGAGDRAREWLAKGSARYLISRRFTLKAELRHARRATLDSQHAYTATSGWLSLILSL